MYFYTYEMKILKDLLSKSFELNCIRPLKKYKIPDEKHF